MEEVVMVMMMIITVEVVVENRNMRKSTKSIRRIHSSLTVVDKPKVEGKPKVAKVFHLVA